MRSHLYHLNQMALTKRASTENEASKEKALTTRPKKMDTTLEVELENPAQGGMVGGNPVHPLDPMVKEVGLGEAYDAIGKELAAPKTSQVTLGRPPTSPPTLRPPPCLA